MGKNFRKYFILLLIFLIMFDICNINTSARDKDHSNNPDIDARCAVAIDARSKIVLYEKNAYELVPMASTTKMMTSLVLLKYGNLDKEIEISKRAATVRGSTVGYKKGEKIKLKELLCGLMTRSGNDAAIAIAEGISGSVEEFVKLMNEYASEIGVLNTHFQSPHGLDKDEHYSTAYDLAVIACKAKENKLFNDIVSSKDIDNTENRFTRSYHNINKILWEIPEANGVKTGYTGKAGKCLVTSVNIKGNDVIIVVLNCPGRWKETKKINEYINNNYKFKKLFSKGDTAIELNINRKKLKLRYAEDIIIPVDPRSKYTFKVLKPQKIVSTIEKGNSIGELCIYKDERKIYSSPLEASNTIKIRRIFKIPFLNKE
ncbi:D-alanyl-D-alanine carboxypeptidase family protein [Clostridium sp. LBM24168]